MLNLYSHSPSKFSNEFSNSYVHSFGFCFNNFLAGKDKIIRLPLLIFSLLKNYWLPTKTKELQKVWGNLNNILIFSIFNLTIKHLKGMY